MKNYYIEINDPNQQPMLGCLRDNTPHTIWIDDVSKKTHTKKQIKDLANELFADYIENTYPNNGLEAVVYTPTAELKWMRNWWDNNKVCDLDWTA